MLSSNRSDGRPGSMTDTPRCSMTGGSGSYQILRAAGWSEPPGHRPVRERIEPMPVIGLRMSSTRYHCDWPWLPPSRGPLFARGEIAPPALSIICNGGTAPFAEIRVAPANLLPIAPIPYQRLQPSGRKLSKKSDGRIDKHHKDMRSAGPISPAPLFACCKFAAPRNGAGHEA